MGAYQRFINSQFIQLALNSLYYGIGDLLQKFISVLLLPIYTRYLLPEDYGVIALLMLMTLVVSATTMFGLTNGIARYIFYVDKEQVTRDEVVWSPLLFVITLTCIVTAILIANADIISSFLFDNANHQYVVVLTLINVLISNVTGIGRSVLIFEERVKAVNIINISGAVVGVVTGIYLVAFLGRGVDGAIEAGLVSSAFMFIHTYFLSIRRYKLKFNQKILAKQLRFSFPLVATVFAFLLIDTSDRYLLKLYLPLSEVGLYNVGYQVGMLMMLLVGGFTSAWPPFYFKNNQNGEGQVICNNVLKMYVLVAAPFAVLIALFSPIAIKLLTTQAYDDAYTVVPWVALAYLLKGPYLIFVMGLQAKNKTIWMVYLEISAAIINIVLNLLLIPEIGREAAAITTLLSYTFMSVGAFWLVNRVNPIPNISLGKPVLTILMATVGSSVIFLPVFASFPVLISIGSFGVLVSLIALLFREDFKRYASIVTK
ncbi:MAG: flippase [Candidatus Sedimenticola sp. 6PFRAG1]